MMSYRFVSCLAAQPAWFARPAWFERPAWFAHPAWFVLLLGAALAGTAAHAEVTVRQYTDAKATGGETWAVMQAYISGIGQGFASANALLAAGHGTRLYCPLPNLTLNLENYLSLLDAQLIADKAQINSMIEPELTTALMRTFPCHR